MDVNYQTLPLEFSRSTCNVADSFKADCDIIVPDTKSDILRILEVTSHAYITKKEVLSGHAIITGSVFFTLVCLGDDENKTVYGINTSCDFSRNIDCADLEGGSDVLASVRIISDGCELINSRKALLYANLKLFVSASCGETVNSVCEIEGAQCIRENVTSTVKRFCEERSFSVDDTSELPESKSAACDILRTSVRLGECDYKSVQNKLILRGNVFATLLYTTAESIECAEFEVPFTEILDIAGITPEIGITLIPSIANREITVDNDTSGTRRMVNISATVNAVIIGSECTTQSVITDAFLPRKNMQCQRRSVNLNSICASRCDEVYIKETLAPRDGTMVERVFSIIGNPCVHSTLWEGDTLKISGALHTTMLYLSEDGPDCVYTEIPFENSLEIPEFAGCTVSADASLLRMSYTITSAIAIEVRAAPTICVSCEKNGSVEVLTEVSADDLPPEARPSILVTFAEDNDTLWNVAKHYNVALDELCAANAIEDKAALKKGERLIIPT